MRTKTLPTSDQLVGLGEVNDTLRSLGRAEREIAAIEGEMQEEIEIVRAAHRERAAHWRELVRRSEAQLLDFVERNKAVAFAPRRTVELDHGKIGWRRSKELKPLVKRKWADVLEALEAAGELEGIKVTRTVNRDALKGWSDARLKKVNVRRVDRDIAFYAVNVDRLEAGHER